MIRKYSLLLSDKPLCGIDTDKDILNLSSGLVTRTIKKRIITSDDAFTKGGSGSSAYFVINLGDSSGTELVCSHFVYTSIIASTTDVGASITATSYNLRIRPDNVENTTADQFNQWISEQYLAGTPVTVWYVLATPTTETITVPTGLSGTVEGYLNQSGMPTPTNPIYPTANSAPAFKEWFYRKYGIETDTLTSFPAEIIGDGTNAIAVIKGNLLQSGTPSASSPVPVTGVGEMSANLTEVNSFTNSEVTDTGRDYFRAQLRLSDSTNTSVSIRKNGHYKLSVENVGNTTVTFRHSGQTTNILIFNYTATFSTPQTVTVSFDVEGYDPENLNGLVLRNIMLNVGSDELPYAPYGLYIIPISCGNTTISIYTNNPIHKMDGITTPIERTTGGADEISSNGILTRRITKMELDGTEADWRKGGGEGNMAFFVNSNLLNGAAGSPILCSHFPVGNVGSTTTNLGIFISSTGSNLRIRPENVESMELTDWTTWLSNQKAAGTPVTIYYVAAAPTTEQVTVPILSTTGTPEQFDIDTTLKPSEADLTYHGWHRKEPKSV